MIDLHNHILPGVDDGAADMAESLDIARQFESEGVVTIAATPHLNPSRGNGAKASDVRHRVDELREELSRSGVTLEVVVGNELFLTPDAPALLRQDRAASLGDGPAVLVEVDFNLRPPYLENALRRLRDEGYQAVLAHPERYGFVHHDRHTLAGLLDSGVVLQLTAPSLLGEYGSKVRRIADDLLRLGWYATAASDRHHPGTARSLATLHARLSQLGGTRLADLLLKENPARLLAGQPVVAPDPLPEQPTLWGRLFSTRQGELPD